MRSIYDKGALRKQTPPVSDDQALVNIGRVLYEVGMVLAFIGTWAIVLQVEWWSAGEWRKAIVAVPPVMDRLTSAVVVALPFLRSRTFTYAPVCCTSPTVLKA